MGKVAILMGSQSDLEIMTQAQVFLSKYGVDSDLHVASAHRQPDKVHRIVKDPSYDVFIAGAGMAAHLPGVVASLTIKPVIGVPIKSSLDGLDALLAIVQMPPGIPVATVAINGAKNAAILAMQFLAQKDASIMKSLQEFRDSMAE
jgi:5-(carboxyamino)imidazole ribonucleotide mutase